MASSHQSPRLDSRWFAIAFAVVGTVLGFLPWVNWLSAGLSAPWYSAVVTEWISGSAIVLGGAVVLAILSRRIEALWREGALASVDSWSDTKSQAFGIGVALASLLLYAVIAAKVFSRVPISVDELVQLVQARTFATGRLWRPASAEPEFYSVLNMVDANGRYYGQFPPGGPAMLALGVLGRAPWLVGPVCGGVSVAAFWAYLRVVEPRRGVAVGAVLLFALTPFAVFMSGSHMNHVPTLMWLLVAMAAMARVMTSSQPAPGLALLNGLAFGCAATIRPVDALAFAFPAGVWYAGIALGTRARWRDAIAVGVGVAIPLCAMMWVNAQTTGKPLLFGYQVLWGRSHDLGFHRAPWGLAHTPARGLELLNLYVLRLQTYLYESPIPSLVPFLGALYLTRRVDRFDRYMFASAVLLLGLYFAYWHDGFLFGPRFVFPLIPMLALWTARFPSVVRERFGIGLPYRVMWYGLAVGAVVAAFVSIPARVREYSHSFVPMRLDYLAPARKASVDSALIFVRESWGTQIMARMWALGVPRSETELLYGNVDACMLEQAITAIEHAGARGTTALSTLMPLLADSARTVKTPFSLDVTERYLPGTVYAPTCVERIAEDRLGFTLLAPLLYTDWGTNVYARDMHARNLALVRRYPNRPVYLLRPPSNATGALPELYPLRRDSLLAAWGAE
ncbi:MAG: hypothetical protein ACJ785_11205 [Gemmatimonadaceae bacterium]